MSLKKKLLLLYLLVGFEGVLFVEFQNAFVLDKSWSHLLKYNLPFVAAQNLIFILVFYFYSIFKLKPLIRIENCDFEQLSNTVKDSLFNKLVLFPSTMFRFSLIFMVSLGSMYHIYELIFFENLTKDYFVSTIFSFLREQSIGMIITLTIVAFLRKTLRPYIVRLNRPFINGLQLTLSKKIYLVFFSILFIFLTDIIWLTNSLDETIEKEIVKIGFIIIILLLLSIVTIKLILMDSFKQIIDVAKHVSAVSSEDRESLHSKIPVTSSDEVSYLITNFNQLQVKIQELYKEINDELKLAINVQKNLLPKTSLSIESLEVHGASIPVKEVGGDFFDILKINDNKIGVLIGDVSGKGLPAALFMSVMVGLVRGRIHDQTESPAQLLEQLNQLLIPMLGDDGMYVTAGIGIIDLETEMMTYSSAGHVSPIIKTENSTYLLETSSFPLGIDPTEKYLDYHVPFNGFDSILFYTDGIIEQTNDDNEIFGFQRLLEAFSINPNENPDWFLSKIREYSSGKHIEDDRTIVQIRKVL